VTRRKWPVSVLPCTAPVRSGILAIGHVIVAPHLAAEAWIQILLRRRLPL
jgi:hypothetical protein